jgi:hypothetical protein
MVRPHSAFFGMVFGLVAVALLATACQDAARPNAPPGKPQFWLGEEQCTTGKWTGGGRIDPPGNHDLADEPFGGQPPAPNPPPLITGKVTFGFNVFLGSGPDGSCVVTKGEIQVNGHASQLAWHVSIHDGVDAYDGRPVYAKTFTDASGGQCVVVGLQEGGYMTARVNPQQGFELTQFEGCDNDRGGPQNTRSDAMRWRSEHHGDTGLTYLTGGNIVDHS